MHTPDKVAKNIKSKIEIVNGGFNSVVIEFYSFLVLRVIISPHCSDFLIGSAWTDVRTPVPMFSRTFTQVTHIKLPLFSTQKRTHACQSPAFALPVRLLSSSTRSPLYLALTRFNPRCGLLEYIWSNQILVFCSTIVVSSYLNSYELVTVIPVVIC
ncbi:unnamed protein product [Hymenolepis diminuta]|uniref:Uncharacterized protein n=1 Tax=Hymenolepis diminuta TaxID=6216 RepID=A0A564Y9M9_HYMDI|nr:unnamed protein product [Hymenolepis diminuta]